MFFNAHKNKTAETTDTLHAVQASQAVIEFTPDGTILAANENFLNAMGYTLDEIRGQHHRMFVDPTYAASPEYLEFWKKLAAGHFDAAEYKRFGRNGREIRVERLGRARLPRRGEVPS